MKPLLAILMLVSLAAAGRAQDVVFIVHPGVPDTTISPTEVRNVLLGTKTSWHSGPIRLVVQRDGPAHEWVVREFTQRTPDQFDKFWKKQVFTGKGTMPIAAKNEAEAVDLVATTPGAFGYASRAAVTDKVKVLEVK